MTDLIEKYTKAKDKFLSDLNDLLIYDQPRRIKYERLYDNYDSSGLIRVFLQRKTRHIMKVFIRISDFDQDEPISLTVDDEDLLKVIKNLPSYNDLKLCIIDIKDDNDQSRLYDKLKYNI
jgi:hypothetical protein